MKINEKNLSAFANLPPYDLQGFLNKKGEVNKVFQRRYFALKGNLLYYFEKKGDKEPLGLIIVEGCTIELSAELDAHCFQIVFNGNRSYTLEADDQKTMELWMKTLACASFEYKKILIIELERQLKEIKENYEQETIKQTSLDSITLPKPPPRFRQNPFNRPAPPIPDSFVKERQQLLISENSNKWNLCNNEESINSPRSNTNINNYNLSLSSNSNSVFDAVHKAFKLIVLNDINQYRRNSRYPENKPLIEF